MKTDSCFFKKLQQNIPDNQLTVKGHSFNQAAVLVPFVALEEPSILLTVRASHLSVHPGEVAFPGGMWEEADQHLLATALRETFEELNIAESSVQVLGRLSTTVSKTGVKVHPFVGQLSSSLAYTPCSDEVDAVFTVPWSFFVKTDPVFETISRQGVEIQLPHYYYRGQHIWGLTAMILLQLLNLQEAKNWPLPQFDFINE